MVAKPENCLRAFFSEAVRDVASMGELQAAAQRLAVLVDMRLLEIPLQALDLANALILATALPAKTQVDALHIAIAAYEKMDFVLTWNSNTLPTHKAPGRYAKSAHHSGRYARYCAPRLSYWR